VEVAVEVCELVGQVVSVRDDVEMVSAVPLLHLDDIGAQMILPGELGAVGEVVNFLVVGHVLIDVILERLARPQNVPLVPLSLLESVILEDGLEQLRLALHQFEKHLIGVVRHVRVQDGSLLEVDRRLPLSDENGGILKQLEGYKFLFQIVLNPDILLLDCLR